ncbi:MAG TPA: hypothetical protein VH518_19970 [Tepidisphaeraceae bacterium]|jgi:hypothetical protein
MSHVLTYDTLPAHSRLKREFADGVLRITATAEEPGPLVRRAAMFRAAVPATMICFVVLLVGLAVFGSTYRMHRRLMPEAMSLSLFVAFVIFCTALFALVWRAQYAIRINAAHKALQQNTILAASPGRLVIETTGPMGASSFDLSGTVRAIRQVKADGVRRVDALEILLVDGSTVQILPGRDAIELAWVARTVGDVVRKAGHA